DFSLDTIEAEKNMRHREMGPYCGWSGNRLTTSAHFMISPRKYLSNSSGVIDIGNAPCSFQSFMISGRFVTSFTAALSLSITGFGGPAGGIKPSQMVAS